MFKRSLLSVVLVSVLAAPAIHASDSEKRYWEGFGEHLDELVDDVTNVKEYEKAFNLLKNKGLSKTTLQQLWRKHCVQTATVLSVLFVTLMNIKKAPCNILIPAFLVSGYKIVRDRLRK